jgi:DNA-binding LytR/AlgR family response regulator
MALNVLIVEDEFIIAEDIRVALMANGYRVSGIARNFDQALEQLRRTRPDFALIDITLNTDQSGIELGRMLSEDLKIPYIYVSSHSDAATLEKVKLTQPSGYLLKPFQREAVFTAIEVALVNYASRSGFAADEQPTVTVKRKEERIRLRYSEILFIESDSNYSHIQTVTARYTERKTLKDMLAELNQHPFIRVHKSYAVNRSKIHMHTREKLVVGGHDIPIGRKYYQELSVYLNQ